MARYSQITLDQGAINVGALLGTAATSTLYKKINEKLGIANSYFGSEADPMRMGYQNFMTSVVNPIQMNNQRFIQANVTISKPDIFQPILSLGELMGVPPCMHVPILQYRPVLDLLKEGRIDGYGYDPNSFPEDDVYDRLINNGKVLLYTGDEVFKDPENPNMFVAKSEFRSYDPKLTEGELTAVELTRAFIDKFLEDPETSHLDPTNPTELRG